MKKRLVTFAIASSLLAGTSSAYANQQDTTNNRSKQYIGTGIGAVAGALVAGPVGFFAGGLLGNLAGKHDSSTRFENEQQAVTEPLPAPQPELPAPSMVTADTQTDPIIVAQAADIDSVIDDAVGHSSNLQDILVSELNMDIFFLSGSTAVESFYKSRLNAVAMLMQEMPDIDLYLDGYSDRRGDKNTNLALSAQRLESVRDELVNAGIDNDRIHINALGEQQFVSRPGDLEAYTFDRRVVIHFGKAAAAGTRSVAQTQQAATL
jgi:sortase system peptidoglycan-associated protein